MIPTLALAYAYVVGNPQQFSVKVDFEGFVPIFGGKEGKASARFTVKATPKEAQGDNTVIESQVTEFAAEAFGATLPLNGNNISQYFPTATALVSPLGEILRNDAPKIPMPVKVPGLDSQRLPEISYLPIQLPKGDPKIGEKYEYERQFGGIPVKYTVKFKGSEADKAQFDITLYQAIDSFEDIYNNPSDEKGARYKLTGVMVGAGTATFNIKAHQFEVVKVTTVTDTKVVNVKTKKSSDRKLKTVLEINRIP